MRSILGTRLRAWAAVGAWVLLLYSSPGLLNTWYRWAFRELGGRQPTSFWVNATFVVLGGAVAVLAVRRLAPPFWSRLAALALIAGGLTACLLTLEIPAKRLHFLQYAPLTLLVLHAVSFSVPGRLRYAWTLALVTLIGWGDELVQSQTPNRYFGWLDISVNATAAVLTLAFVAFVLRSGPEPRRDPTHQRIGSGCS